MEAKQRNLDSLSNQHSKAKVDLHKLSKKSEKVEELEALEKELNKKIKELEDENRAYKEFVSENVKEEAIKEDQRPKTFFPQLSCRNKGLRVTFITSS